MALWERPLNNYCIYALLCPKTQEVKYIGQTTIGIDRFRLHWKDMRPNKFGKIIKIKAWIKSLKKQNLKFDVKYLDYGTTREELNTKEIYWIKYYKNLGVTLLNHTEGGHLSTMRKLTKVERKRISDNTINQFKNSEFKTKWRKAIDKRVMPKNYIPRTEETKRKSANSTYILNKMVKVIDNNGLIYNSLKDCAKQLNVTPQAIHRTINGRQKTCKNLILKRFEEKG